VLAQRNNSPRINISPHSGKLYWFRANTSLLLLLSSACIAEKQTRCIGATRMSPSWILRRLANVSPFFNSLSNRLRITNYCLRSVSSSLLKFTRFIQGNKIAWTNLDMVRNIQHLHMNKKSYTYKTLPFNSHWIFFWIKSVMWSQPEINRKLNLYLIIH
jgi:hypothetical protein